LRTTYRGFEIVGFPPPSSGGVHVAQILNILESFDLRAMGDGSVEFIHTVAEAMKLAFADRAVFLGDPDFELVPPTLVDKKYAKSRAEKIGPRANAVTHGNPLYESRAFRPGHTTHFSIADADGWWVGCTATINTTWGSLVTIPGTGVILNNEMDDFSIQPGVPNAFGLVGAEVNAIKPRKRPLSSMSPTIVLRDGKPVLVTGGAGGPTIISQTVLAIVRTVDFDLSPSDALARPRFHHQWRPDKLRIERSVPEAVRAELQKRGHELEVVNQIGVSQAVSAKDGIFSGAHDPRAGGKAAGQ
jgi:gamma-glutamyltranspeptidase / glutathione hydrolase